MPEVDCELYKLITIGGSDAVEFLQGQLTQDVGTARLQPASCQLHGATRKVVVVVTIRLVQVDDGIGLIVPTNMADRVNPAIDDVSVAIQG